MPRALLLALALGGLSALAHAAVLLGGVGGLIFALLAPLPMFYAGLTLGVRSIAVAALGGAIVTLPIGLWPAAGFVLEVALAPLVLVQRALLFRTAPDGTTEWYPPGPLFGWLAALAAVGVTGVFLWFLGSEGGLTARLQSTLTLVLEEMQRQGQFGDAANPQDPAMLAGFLARLLPGMAASFWMLVMVANGVLAQGLALRFGKAIRPGARLREMEVPIAVAVGLGAALLLTFLGGMPGALGLSLVPVFALPFLFQGCAVVHVAARRTPFPGLTLGLFYLLMVIFGAMIALAILLGLAEHWLKLRQRLAGPAG